MEKPEDTPTRRCRKAKREGRELPLLSDPFLTFGIGFLAAGLVASGMILIHRLVGGCKIGFPW